MSLLINNHFCSRSLETAYQQVMEDHELNELLIELVRAKSQLWQKTDKTYRHTETTQKNWVEIANLLEIDVETAKKRWRSLRDRFVREMKPSKTTGSGAKRVNQWAHMESLMFLVPTIIPRMNPMKAFAEWGDPEPSSEFRAASFQKSGVPDSSRFSHYEQTRNLSFDNNLQNTPIVCSEESSSDMDSPPRPSTSNTTVLRSVEMVAAPQRTVAARSGIRRRVPSNVNQLRTQGNNSRKRRMGRLLELKRSKHALEARKVAVEERRVAVEEMMVAVEERRVAVEERRVAVEERRVDIEERRVAVEERRVAVQEN